MNDSNFFSAREHMSLEEACAAPIPDSDSGSEGLDCEELWALMF